MKTNIKTNIISSLSLQIISAICSVILPPAFILSYGSEVYGSIATITQIMGFLGLLEAGIGSVAYVALYHALSQDSNEELAIVRNTIKQYYLKIAIISIGLCAGIAIGLPFLLDNGKTFAFNLELCLIIGCGHFVQYYFGITNQLMLNADFKGYVNSLSSIGTTLLNCALTYLLINIGCTVLTVKFVSAMVFLLRPVILNIYVRKRYQFPNNKKTDQNLLAQRWNNLGQTLAFYLHSQTDIVLITIFLSVAENAVYSLYAGIVSAIKMVINVIMNNYTSILGRACSQNEPKERIEPLLTKFCGINNFFTNTLFTVLAILIIPFMKIYTKDFADYLYIRPTFAYLLCLAEFVYLMRFPYNTFINVKGHFKETQMAAYMEAGLNLVLSIVFIQYFGVVGCMLGTIVAMLFRYIYCVIYVKVKMLDFDIKTYFKVLLENTFSVIGTLLVVLVIDFSFVDNYVLFFLAGALLVILMGLINIGVHFVLFRENILKAINYKAL